MIHTRAATFPGKHRLPVARRLVPDDIPALLRLEARQWAADQRADETGLAARLARWPALCLGSFDPVTGEALASLFMRLMDSKALQGACSWSDALNAAEPPPATRSLFGISFTSINAAAADSLFRYFWPIALRSGWRDIYLGSPIPGFARARRANPSLDAERYARSMRRGLPLDPQLRYYYRRGFTELVAIKPGYFPHAESLDVGVLLRGRVPLAPLGSLWRVLPAPAVRRVTDGLARVVGL